MAESPKFNLGDLVARDYDATVAFYRRLGVDVDDGPGGEIRHPYLEFDVDYDSTDTSTVPGPARVRAVGGRHGHARRVAELGHDGGQCRVVLVGQRRLVVPSDRRGCDSRPAHRAIRRRSARGQTLMIAYPNARVRPTVAGVPGLFLIRAGGPVAGGFVGATDNVIVGIGTTTTESNFEPGDGHVVVHRPT